MAKDSRQDYVVLRCRKCRQTKDGWELGAFMRRLGKEYERERLVLQFCGCENTNTEHVIVGICTVVHKPRTPGQVFATYKRRRKSKR